MFIPDLGSGFLSTPVPGVKKALDPGSETLHVRTLSKPPRSTVLYQLPDIFVELTEPVLDALQVQGEVRRVGEFNVQRRKA
jgi:hypothetical protein